MNQPPRDPDAPVLNSEMKFLIGLISGVTGLMVLMVFLFFNSFTSLQMTRTVTFATLAINSLIYVFSVRSLKHSIFKGNLFNNRWLIAAVAGGLCIQLSAQYLPPLVKLLHLSYMGIFEWSIVLLQSIIVVFLIEIVKWVYNRRLKA